MNPNKALWEKGDFTRIAATMRASGAAFVDGLAVARDLDVLDLGCGDGTTAIPAAIPNHLTFRFHIASRMTPVGMRLASSAASPNP